ncbi:MAG: AbrB/MazE/SpoVT family DNA-binding domain-containing protein [Ktedonobacteraceae bacterium]
MHEIKTKLLEGCSVVIPVPYCQALGLQTGDELIMRLEDGEIRIVTPQSQLKHAQDLIRHYIPQGRLLSDELLAERRLESKNSAYPNSTMLFIDSDHVI